MSLDWTIMFSLDPELVALALGNARLATWEWVASSDVLRWTSGQTEIYSRPSNEINSTAAWAAMVHPEDRGRVSAAAKRALETRSGFREQFRVLGKEGSTLWILGYARVVTDADGTLRMIGMNMEVTEWVEALASAKLRFTATFEQAAVGIAHIGIDGRWLNVNRRCCEIVGYSKEELLRLTFADITHPDDLGADLLQVRGLLSGERSSYSMEKRYLGKGNWQVWVNLTVSLVLANDGKPDYFISVIEDITSRKQIEAERDALIEDLEQRVRDRTAALEKLSMTDALTGIANRRRLDEQLRVEWDRAVRACEPIALILVDVDHFKDLNDAVGHGLADRILVSVAEALTGTIRRPADLAARYGGDEFVLVLPDTDTAGAITIANQVQAAIDGLPSISPGSSPDHRVTISQGLAIAWPTNKGEQDGLLLSADQALYASKKKGRNCISVAGAETAERR